MTNDQMQEFARVGAQARLQAIEEERSAIVRAFPDLGSASGRSNEASSPARRGRKGMSPSLRKAVGERMKAYWAKRRGKKAATSEQESDTSDTPSAPAKRKSGMSAEARKAQGERMKAYWAAKRDEKHGASRKRAGRKTGRKK